MWVCVVLLLAGCEGAPARPKPWRSAPDPMARSGKTSKGPSEERAALDARRRRTLRIRLPVEPTHLNPLVDPESEALQVVEDTVFESLVRYEPGHDDAYAPGLAESFRVVAGGTELRFLLREGVTFHDGAPLSAVDVQFTLDWIRSKESRASHWKQALADVVSVEKWGPRDLRLQLRRPNAHVLRALAAIPILPAHVYGAPDGMRASKGRSPIGTGPYRLAAWEPRSKLILARNEGYWGTAPAIEQIDFVIEPDGARALVLARQGQIDVLPSLIPQHVPEQLSAPGMDRFTALSLRPPRFRFVAVHAGLPPFDDVRVREAAARLIDRERICREVSGSLCRPIAGPVWPGGPGDGDAPAAPAFDPARAMALLDEAGWPDVDKDGIRERPGERLRITLLATSDSRGDLERDLIVSSWRKAGFVVEVLPGEPAVLLNRLRAHTFHAALVEWRGSADEDLAPLLASRGALNWGLFSSRTIDGLLSSLSAEQSPQRRRLLATELGKQIAAEWPIIPLTAPEPRGLVHRRIGGVRARDGWISIRDLTIDPAVEP
jgi:peptide/nickel transport system substrate-binding protein